MNVRICITCAVGNALKESAHRRYRKFLVRTICHRSRQARRRVERSNQAPQRGQIEQTHQRFEALVDVGHALRMQRMNQPEQRDGETAATPSGDPDSGGLVPPITLRHSAERRAGKHSHPGIRNGAVLCCGGRLDAGDLVQRLPP